MLTEIKTRNLTNKHKLVYFNVKEASGFVCKTEFVCLFELMLNVPVNSHGNVGTLPPFHGTFTQNEDVMTFNKCFKYKHPIEPQTAYTAYTYEWSDLNHFSLQNMPMQYTDFFQLKKL